MNLPPQSRIHNSVALQNFGSQWFLLPQGTGILALVLYQLEYQFRGLGTISVIFWITNITLLSIFTIIYIARFIISPKYVIRHILSDTTEAACLASFSISLTSVIQMLSLVVVPSWGGPTWGLVAYILWWVNLGMAVVSCLGLPLLFIHSIHEQGGFTKSLTPTAQLPIIAALTSAAAAGTLCQSAMLSTKQQIPMIVVAYLEIGLGLPLVLALDVLFLVRILLPQQTEASTEPQAKSLVYTHMVLCGPWGQSSFALQVLGMALLRLQNDLDEHPSLQSGILISSQAVGPIAYASMFIGLIVWGQGTFWWVFAVGRITRYALKCIKGRTRLLFGIPTWSIIFPWGVYTNTAVQLGKLLDSPVLKVWSTVLAALLVIMWLLLAALTIRGVLLGTLLGYERGWRRKLNGETA